MKLTNRLIKSSIISLFMLYSCSSENSISSNTIKINDVSKKNFDIKGKVEFESFKIKSESSITKKATVSLIYPAIANENSFDRTVATGLTDNNGNFQINTNQNFVPEINKIMILEASKRIGGVGNTSVSLRTNLKWNGGGWESISSPSIYINKRTTSLSIISALDSATMNYNESLNRLSYHNGIGHVIYDNKLTVSKFNTVINYIDKAFSEGKDPVEEIFLISKYGTINYHLYHNNVRTNVYEIRNMLETYSVDWNGCYPSNIDNLKIEATSKKYWREIKNPFIGSDLIPSYLPTFINGNEYETTKSTLNYKGNTLSNKEDLKGMVIYYPQNSINNPTEYTLYGIGYDGEFIKKDEKYDLSIFSFTNAR